MIGSLLSNAGVWMPLAWLFVLVVTWAIVYYIRSRGEARYHKDTEQVRPFLAGHPETSKAAMHVRTSNEYWGFMEALKGYYHPLIKGHTGNLNDYICWFICILAIVLVLVISVGV
ncbi:MAG: hydrogenase [Deltaproteobacteria bacterium]|nr:MAG: hydrogenase [Deltaproteobacteria bacterium]